MGVECIGCKLSKPPLFSFDGGELEVFGQGNWLVRCWWWEGN